MSVEQTYTVTGMTCGHCVASVTAEVQEVAGVASVDVVLTWRKDALPSRVAQTFVHFVVTARQGGNRHELGKSL